jgi:outer membrane protein assembly factor BamB
VNAQLTKVYETKINVDQIINSEKSNELLVHIGVKNFDVIQIETGKVLIEKDYRVSGASFDKAFDGIIQLEANKLIVCDKKNVVTCINITTGEKIWEVNSFVELGSDRSALDGDSKFVIVSDKKAKNSYTLTCLDINTGKQIWQIENEAEKIERDDLLLTDKYLCVGKYNKKNEKVPLRLINLETGKNEISSELDGEVIVSYNDDNDKLYFHHRISETKSFLSAIDLTNKKVLWKINAVNKSPNLPMVMNIDRVRYYATIQSFDDKVMLITEGVEVFDVSSGKSLYNIPFIPYTKEGVGHYIDGIFEPIVTEKGILLADRSSGEVMIKLFDKNKGTMLWSSEKIKKAETAPTAFIKNNQGIVQFGGACTYEVMNNGNIGKLLGPFKVIAFDLQTGKISWTQNAEKDFYYIVSTEEGVLIIGTKELQMLDLNSGNIAKSEKNYFDESYFLTKVGLERTRHQKTAEIDFDNRLVVRVKDNKLIKSKF